ncbi:hypothetical protein PII47_11760 [Pseudomonas sp. 21TX0197]|uniref:hypothetical protein n=1 Tax=Pseudomonas TaxID=286 RepID=UPI00091AFB85|nr:MULTISPECIES: hypothetical protein [Pseudomonas]MDB6444064.1 hypothetical protein [Pseudomonas sp. 21TX0197]MDT8908832.1 hypothetical protein [Pseudomonas prosekii]NHN66327.1 hypothetical protein [Pseudomonas fluorescens]ROO41316.1 hypothetical protein BIV09_07580 [Pseudomonas sp. 7SR1]SFX72147.1 3-oxoacyl-[acyl-carrier-protein] synthase-3 [Pseudomonas sp. NFACC49-2]
MRIMIDACSYALGEVERPYHDVPDFKAMLDRFGYPDEPGVFGWGSYFKTDGDIFDLGIRSARQTLAQSRVSAGDIDFVMFCSTCFPGNEIEYINFNVRLYEGLELRKAFPIGVTLNNCISFMSAIVMAESMVRAGVYNNILIITADKVYDESIRFNNFALLSDSAASCLVTRCDGPGLEIVSSRFGVSQDPITSNHGKDEPELYGRILNEVLETSGITLADISKVFCNNIFRPVTQLKETRLGFSRRQLYLDNVARCGHCFSADTMINYVDYARQNTPAEGQKFLFSIDAPNLRANLLAQYTPQP